MKKQGKAVQECKGRTTAKEKKRRHQMNEEEKARWNMSYKEGYEETQSRRRA